MFNLHPKTAAVAVMAAVVSLAEAVLAYYHSQVPGSLAVPATGLLALLAAYLMPSDAAVVNHVISVAPADTVATTPLDAAIATSQATVAS